MQPHFLPWMGLFNQIKLCDIFVHFDDVKFPQGRSFTNRVQLKTQHGPKWLTVPVVKSTRKMIKDVRIINGSGWKKVHLSSIQHNLSKAPHYAEIDELVSHIYSNQTESLSEFNINAIEKIARYMGLKAEFMKSSEVANDGSSSERLINIVKKLGGRIYLTGHGAKNYLNHERFEKEKISVEYIQYNFEPYDQFFGEFIPYVTIVDLLAHTGSQSHACLKSKTIDWRTFLNE